MVILSEILYLTAQFKLSVKKPGIIKTVLTGDHFDDVAHERAS